MGFKTNNKRFPEPYSGYLIKTLRITSYNNEEVYEEANLVQNSDLWNLYEKEDDKYIRTKDKEVIPGKTYYIRTIQTLPDNQFDLKETKIYNQETDKIPFKFAYAEQYELDKVLDARNIWGQDSIFNIKTTSSLNFTSTDSVEINDTTYSITGIYYNTDSRTNRIGEPTFIKYISLKI
nr:MAG TPA: hypothetical protein [Caudoviricetes sp.]